MEFTQSKEQLTLFAADSLDPAKTSALLAKARELKANVADCGESMPVLLAKYDRDTSSWKTSQLCLDGGYREFLGIWPRSGMTRSGRSYQLTPLVPHINEKDVGLWPTPSGVRGAGHCVGAISEWGGSSNPFRGTELRNLRLPTLEEWMMGFPESWTELTHYVTPLSRKSLKSSDEQ